MRVLRSHQHRPALTVQDAQEAIKDLALRLSSGAVTLEDQALEEKLKKATGISVAELAHFAVDWPDDVRAGLEQKGSPLSPL
jgi:rRNA-processing protein FCF1